MTSTTTPRRRAQRRRRPGLFQMLEQLSDDQVLLCPCGEHATSCGG
jgi:hypothetical protein